MLDVKKHRLDYGAMLIPPKGYRLAKAVAATYTLDLNTLLSIPVALFFSQTLEGNFEAERVQLLEAIQRCPEVLRIYHQSGKIHIPRKNNRLYGLLERCVVGVLPKNAYSSFHPKVWVLRFEQEEQPTLYRLLVLSRNLTYDRSWDIAAQLDGKVTETNQGRNDPLVKFVKYLTNIEGFDGDRKFISDLRKVEFEAPAGFGKNFFFHPLGLEGQLNPLVDQKGHRAICISPFVHDDALRILRKNVSDELMLFGCREELRRLKTQTLSDVRTFCISDLIVDGENKDDAEDGKGENSEQNLHAKLYVFQGETSAVSWFLGSANATKAAFERNTEFLLELRGSSAAVQLDRLKEQLLGHDEHGGIFQQYEVPDEEFDDSDQRTLENKLREIEFSLLKNLKIVRAAVVPSENQSNYDLILELNPDDTGWMGMSVRIAPFNTEGIKPLDLPQGRTSTFIFQNISESNLSQFLQFEIWDGSERLKSFLMKIEIAGLPETRVGSILRSIINSRDRFFEYLRFLLTDDENKEPAGADRGTKNGDGTGEDANIWDLSTPIFEQLLLAASRCPSQLQAINDVIQQLCEEGEKGQKSSIIPDEFKKFWEAFRQMVPEPQRRRRT